MSICILWKQCRDLQLDRIPGIFPAVFQPVLADQQPLFARVAKCLCRAVELCVLRVVGLAISGADCRQFACGLFHRVIPGTLTGAPHAKTVAVPEYCSQPGHTGVFQVFQLFYRFPASNTGGL